MMHTDDTDEYIAERSSPNCVLEEIPRAASMLVAVTSRYRHAEASTTRDMSTDSHVSIRSIPFESAG